MHQFRLLGEGLSMPCGSRLCQHKVGLVGLACGLIGLACGAAALAQPAAADSDPLLQRVRKMIEAEQYVEAEKACLEALKGTDSPDAKAANVAPWARRQELLAEVQIRMFKFGPAQERLKATLAVLQRPASAAAEDAARRLELGRTQGLLAAWAETCGRGAERLASLRAGIDVLQKLAAEYPRRAEYGEELLRQKRACAAALMTLARYQESEAAYEEGRQLGRRLLTDFPAEAGIVRECALACNNEATLLREWGRPAQAAALISEAIGLLARMHREHGDHPEHWRDLPGMHRHLAGVLASMGYTIEAAAANRGAVRWEQRLPPRGDDPKTKSADRAGTPADPKSELEHSLARAEQEARDNPEVPRFRTRLLTAQGSAAMRFFALGSQEQALRCARQMAEGADEVAAKFPDVPTYQGMRADGRLILGMMQLRCGHAVEGEKCVREGLQLARQLAAANAEDPSIRYHVAAEALTTATVFGSAGETERSRRLFAEAITELQTLAKKHPQCPLYRRQLAEMTMAGGPMGLAGGDEAAAETAFREGIRLWRQVVADFPATKEFRHGLASALLARASFVGRSDHHPEAEGLVVEALRLQRALAEACPDRPEYRVALAEDWAFWGQVKERQRQRAEAVNGYTQAVTLLEAAVKAVPSRRGWVGKLQDVLRLRGSVLDALSKDAEAEADRKRAGELEDLLQSPPLRLVRIDQRIEQGQLEPAVREADDLFFYCDLSAWQYHQLAGVYARAAAAPGTADKETWAARAVESLRRAYEGGYRCSTSPAQDPQFQPLAGRADFRELTAQKWK